MYDRKSKKIIKDYIFLEDIISLLLFENDILQKKLNNIKLTSKEEIFDNFFVSPSLMVKCMLETLGKGVKL